MFYFDRHFGLFVGKLTNNKSHQHYALQLSFSTAADLVIILPDNKQFKRQNLFINSKIKHSLTCDQEQLTILVNPLSAIGYQLMLQYKDSAFSDVAFEPSELLTQQFVQFKSKECTFNHFCEQVTKILSTYQSSSSEQKLSQDDRILSTLDYLDQNHERVVSLKEVADFCHLSPTRFQHLFKEKTASSFRRYQLWNRVIKSIPYLASNNISQTAHQFGFTDSSHYTRTFIESFGFSPKFFTTKS